MAAISAAQQQPQDAEDVFLGKTALTYLTEMSSKHHSTFINFKNQTYTNTVFLRDILQFEPFSLLLLL